MEDLWRERMNKGVFKIIELQLPHIPPVNASAVTKSSET